jgi:dihydrofolate reductase
MGGEQVYSSFLPYIDKWIVTEVPLTVEGTDAFVPQNYLEGFRSAGAKQLDQNLTVRFYERSTI